MNPDQLLDHIPGASTEPVFDAPWQAQAFAMTVKLHEAGRFTWIEWAEALSNEIKTTDLDNSGALNKDGSQDGYYRAWLAALEKLVVEKQLGSINDLNGLKQQWASAAEKTPHGEPIKIDATIERS